ncbi:DUF5719 family protein [Knoellia sp. CPCC 206453]|uniref:DUF5719 family protein n=1 Tax=Knoellia pratensis TaxID=3404796 RepID=UPI0036148549
MNRSRLVGPGRLALTALVAAGLVTGAALSPAADQIGSEGPAARPTTAASFEPVVSANLSCPGPEFSGITGVEDIDVPASLAVATAPDSVLGSSVKVTGEGRVTVRSGTDTGDPVTERGTTTTVRDLRSGRANDVVAVGAMAPGLAATQEWLVARSEIRGLATVSCASPGSDLWLLAGGGAAGRQERLILTNSGANEVTVDLEVLGRKGVVASPTGSTVVPARGRVALLVDAITGAEESPAVRVRATGGSVRAVMSDIWLDGSVPAGAETTVPTAAPSTRQVIPAAIVGVGGAIRIAVPGLQQAVVSARILGEDGPVPLAKGVTRVPGRSTGELSLTGLKQGKYAVELTSDVPIAAALWSSWRLGKTPGDFIWAPSTESSTGLLAAAFPGSEDARERNLSLASSAGPATASVTWRAGGKWTTKSVGLGQDASVTLNLGAAESVWVQRISGRGEIRAAVGTVAGKGGGERLVSVSPLVETAVTSTVSSAHPIS